MAMEKRAHARVASVVAARVVMGREEVEYPVRDISRGGVFLNAKSAFAPVGGKVQLRLALAGWVRPVTLHAQVTRVAMNTVTHAAATGIGLKFQFESPTQSAAVLDLIDRSMDGPGTEKRAWPRVQVLINATLRGRSELRVQLRDLCEGGAGMIVPEPVGSGDEVTLELARLGKSVLAIKGWIAACDPLPNRGHRAGMKFAALSRDQRAEVLEFLKAQYRK